MLRRTFIASPSILAAAPAASLDQRIQNTIRGFQGTVSICARNLDSGKNVGLKADAPVRTASTIKLPIMAALFRAVEEGRASWTETLLLRDEDKVSGSGVLHEFSGGVRLPLRDVMHLMIVVSDNTATNLILDRISADAVNAEMDRYGLSRTRSLRKVRGDGNVLKAPSGWSKAGLLEENKRFGLGVSTPREMVELLDRIANGKAVSAAASKEMIEVLKRQQYKDGIGRRLSGVEVASKSGALDALRSDVGIVYGKRGRIAIAITVDDMPKIDYTADNVGNILIAEISRILVEML
ncbi:MAG: serine hydrolase [Bryobacterales bacterium]|nr:serine hydrolase [Bryobacterales bacterium]